ncbi:MAG: methionyl-tRNA formyltransferase [Xanthomonadales bacterium]|nr:methionyl-tRNA formyltransferase [Xanthomonadales bacterium]
MKNQNPPLRVLFAGTPEFALSPLQALIDEACVIVGVLTQPDRPAGRGKQLRASPVKQLALENNLEVLQPESLKDAEWQEKLAGLQPDLMVVVAYGLMIPDRLLTLPRFGCWNIHASLLPRWRGAAPIQRAIEAGDDQTGVCIMQIEATLDTGPVYKCLTTAIEALDTAGSLHDRLAVLGAQALRDCIKLLIRGELPQAVVQDDSQAVYASKLSKAEAELDWNQAAEVLQRRVRAFNPWPVAWCVVDGQRLRIWKAEVVDDVAGCNPGAILNDRQSLIIGTAEKSLKILELQRAGGQRMTAEQFLNAYRPHGQVNLVKT